MSTEREYIVTLRDKNDATDFITQMTDSSAANPTIPARSVTVVDERPFSDRNTHYALTDAEAEQLRNDPRVLAVAQPPQELGYEKVLHKIQPAQNFHRDSVTINNTMRNWGLYRHSQLNAGYVGDQVTGDYTYNQDGSGVDLILIDSGIFGGHPEWSTTYDGTGPTRLVDFNWASLGVPGTPTSGSIGGYIGDSDGHGSNCASLAAGSHNGMAKGTALYSIRIFGGGALGAISDTICFDIVKAFHLAKVAAGNKRPTVCTNSWGWRSNYPSSCTTFYRGTTYTHTGRNSTYGQVNSLFGIRITALDADVSDCIDTGVIMLGAAGNYYHKIDSPGGLDWDNTVNGDYYHRGSSPTGPNAVGSSMICVGALDQTSTEQKTTFSETGPGVSIYAAGAMTMGAYSNSAYYTNAVTDSRNASYYLNKLSGTSMATPITAGVACLMADMRPNYTNSQIRDWLIELSDKSTMTEGTAGYTNQRHLQGGLQRVLNWPYNSANPFTTNNLVPTNGAKIGL
jgi:hypothetical protein